MTDRENRFWLLYGVLAGSIAIRFLPLLVGTKWLWGVGHLSLLPFSVQLAFGVLGVVALLFPLLPKAEIWGGVAVEWFDRTFYRSGSKYLYRILTLVLFASVFIVFRMPTHFLGDGYTFLTNVGSEVGRWIKWSEGGALIVTMGVQQLIGSRDIPSALLAFQIVSIVSGVISLWFYFLIAERMSTDPAKRLLSFTLLTGSASLLLFFGYVESYPVLWGPVAGFLYFTLTYLDQRRRLLAGLVCLLLAVALHLQAIIFLPAALYLLLTQGRGEKLYRKFRPLIWTAGVLAVAATGVLFYREYCSNLFFENIFLYPFSGKPIAPGYAVFSLTHVSDILNLFMLVVPLGLLLIVMIETARQPKTRLRRSRFLGLLGVGSGLFLLLVDPSLSMPRDWDLFALCCLAPGLCLLSLIPDATSRSLKRLLLSLPLVAILAVVPFLLVNLSTPRSVAEIEQIIDNNPGKSMGSMSILSTYFDMIGDGKARDSISARMTVTYPEFSQWRSAFKLLGAGKVKEAYALFSQVRPDKFSKDFHSFLALYYLRTGKPDSALVHAQAAVQLQKYVDVNYAPLAYAYSLTGQSDKALEALRQGFALNPRNKELLMSLALIHCNGGRFDSTLFYAEKYHDLDGGDPAYYYVAAKGYFGFHNRGEALEQAKKYSQLGRGDGDYAENQQELEQLMPELKEDIEKR